MLNKIISKQLANSLFICFCMGAFAQSGQIDKDSIDDSFKSIKSIQNEFNKEILKLCSKIDREENSLELYKYMDKIAPTEKSKLLFYNKYISYLLRLNQTDEALSLSEKALKLSKNHQLDRFLFEYTQIKSYIFIVSSKLDSALFYANKAEKIIDENREKLEKYLFRVYFHKAEIEILFGNEKQASEYYEIAAKSLEDLPKNKNYAYVLATVALHFKSTKNYLKHSIYSQKLKAHYLSKGGFNTPLAHLGMSSFLEFEDSEQQIDKLKQSFVISGDSMLKSEQRLQLNELADGLIRSNRPKEAIKYLEHYSKFKESTPLVFQLMSYNLLEEAYSQLGDCDQTLKAVKTKASIIDSLRNELTISKIADAKVKYETEKKEAQLEVLKIEKAKEKQRNNFLAIIGVLSGLVLIITVIFYYKNRKKAKILDMQNQLLERTVDEKNILLKEIHHRVKNSFQIVSSLLYLQSENIDDKEAKLAIKEAENRVRSMVLVHQKLYNKEDLVGINTKEYFGDLVKDIFESHQFKSESITYELEVEPLVLDIETITPLGLILNELIINTLKHAFKTVDEKSKLAINLNQRNEMLVLKVVDNGIGFSDNQKTGSFGIKLIKALSKKLRASIEYKSIPNQGTEAILHVKRFNLIS